MSNETELNPDGTVKETTKIELSTEQQDYVNKIINDRFAKIADKHQKEKEAYATQRVREAEEARQKAIDDANTSTTTTTTQTVKPDEAQKEEFRQLLDNEKNKSKLADAARVKAEKEADEARAEALNVRKTQAIYNAMGKQSFYQPDDVLNLTQGKVIWDTDSKTFVVKENGIIKQNNSLQNMTLEEYYTEVAASRPYLVNGDIKGGAGSRESSVSANAGLVKSKADLKSAKDKSDFITKFGLDRYSELPSK